MGVDIWAWYHSLAAKLGDNTYGQYHAAKEAFDTEGVEAACANYELLAKTHNAPWLGVFGRHWRLQYRLLSLGEGASAVPEAVKAFELAHRAENRDCPQTICTTQDLAIAYSLTDGPGYAEDILAACDETLDRIDPSWPCFDCVAFERARALGLSDRHEEVVAYSDEAMVSIRTAGGRPGLAWADRRARALLETAGGAAAVAYIDGVDPDQFDWKETDAQDKFQYARSWVYACAGRVDEALELASDLPTSHDNPRLLDHSTALKLALLAAGAIPNDSMQGAELVRYAHHKFSLGAYRSAFEGAIDAGIWAARRGALTTAQRCRQLATQIEPSLALPRDAPARLRALDAEIEEAPREVDGDRPELANDAEIERLEVQRTSGDLDGPGFERLGGLLAQQGWLAASTELLWERALASPSESSTVLMLMSLLMSAGADDELSRLAESVEAENPLDARWVRANAAWRLSNWTDVAEHCAAIVRDDDTVKNTRRLWAVAERQLGNFTSAAQLRRDVLTLSAVDAAPTETADSATPPSEAEGAPPDEEAARAAHVDDAWAAILDGTLAQEWDLVRDASAVVGMTLPDDDPGHGAIDSPWYTCLVTFIGDDGRERTNWAVRTGPATARIDHVAHPSSEQHHRDCVVIEPALLDPLPEDEQQRQTFVPRFRAAHTVDRGGYRSIVVLGVATGLDEQIAALQTALVEEGFASYNYEGYEYTTPDGTMATELILAVGFEGAAEQATLEALHALLEAATADWDRVPGWPGLLADIGLDATDHQRRIDSYWAQTPDVG